MTKFAVEMIVNIKGKLVNWERPLMMGVINLTSDSFYSGSRVDWGREPAGLSARVTGPVGSGADADSLSARVGRMVAGGADIIDIGACSTRPGSEPVDASREAETLCGAIRSLRTHFGDSLPTISVDTFRASVAEAAVEAGAAIVNDIGGGDLDPEMFPTVARLKVPYVLTHMRGTPANMQTRTDYDDVVADVFRDLAFKLDTLRSLGVADVIVDPGFGFAKTLDQNYQLLADLSLFRELEAPLLVGLSRKSMICRELGVSAEQALNGTTALNMVALMNGADIIRVHDVVPAVETVKLFMALKRNQSRQNRTIITKSYSEK